MKYTFKEINKLVLPKWLSYLGFSRSFQFKVLDEPEQEGEDWVYPIEIVSHTTKWLGITVKITKL